MGKLYFRYGTTSSGKTAQLLSIWHEYEVTQKKQVMTFKPFADTPSICSKSGESRQADVTLYPYDNNVYAHVHRAFEKPDVILVEEAHHLTAAQVDSFGDIVDILKIPVLCYGQKTDHLGNLSYEGAKRLMEIADKVEEIKGVCYFCPSKSIFNLRFLGRHPIFVSGEIVMSDIDPHEKKYHYKPVCRKCYKKAYGNLHEQPVWEDSQDLTFEEKRYFA